MSQLSENPIHQEIISRIMSHEDHLSYSSMKAFMDSPKSFIQYKLGKKEQTDSMLYGAMLHCLILEPEKFEERYLALDDTEMKEKIGGAKPTATKQYKEWKAAVIANANGRTVISPSEMEHARIVALNVRNNRAAAPLIFSEGAENEVGVEWEFINFKFRGYIDRMKKGKFKLDIKSMPDAQQRSAQRTIINERYYVQAAMYNEATGTDDPFYIIAVDKKGGVSVHNLHKNLIAQGKEEYQNAVTAFNRCILKDKWDESYEFWAERWDGIFECEKPGWMY